MIDRTDWPNLLYELMQQGKKRIPRPVLMQKRVRRFLALMDSPERAIKIIQVAGTNGKGSVSALLAAALEGTGQSVGLFVSPHLLYVSERIRIQGEAISFELLAELSEKVFPVVKQLEREGLVPSFFETMMLIALLAFQKHQVAYGVFEAGTGGFRDATSCLPSILGVLTTVSFDHQKELGSTLAEIAQDKIGAGYSSKKLVLGPKWLPKTYQVICQSAQEKGIQLFSSEPLLSKLKWTPLHPSQGQEASFEGFSFQVPFWGVQQQENTATVLESLTQLQKQEPFKLNQALSHLKKASLPGRFQWVSYKPAWILDVAHNLEAIETLVATLDSLAPFAERRLVFGVSVDKEYDFFLDKIQALASEICLVAAKHRGEDPKVLAKKLEKYSNKLYIYSDLEKGLFELVQKKTKALTIVTGSIFMVGEALDWFNKHSVSQQMN